MGSYLTVDGKQNNAKSITHLMITMLREIFPYKKSLSDGERIFALTQDEVATALYTSTALLEDEELLEKFMEIYSEKQFSCRGIEEIKEDAGWVQRCFAKTLSEMVNYDKQYICCEWE